MAEPSPEVRSGRDAVVPMADWGLLRMAGLPVEMWLAAGSPELFAALRQLDQLESEHRRIAAALAVEIGEVLVPHPRVDPSSRHRALACRRRLYGGLPVPLAHLAGLADTCRSLGLDELAARVELVTELSDTVRDESVRAAGQVACQYNRLRSMPWTLITSSAVGSRALLDESIQAAEDVTRRLAAGESWDSKRLRQRSDYLWRMIARGAMKTTPRGWLGQVALVELAPHADDAAPRVTEDAAAYWAENLQDVFGDCPGAAAELSKGTVVGLAPLHAFSSERLHLWAVDPQDDSRLCSVNVLLTPPLLAVCVALASGACPAREVVTATLATPQDERQRSAAYSLLAALTRLGVLQKTVRRPVSRRTGWRELSRPPERLAPIGSNGFLDVYRRTSGRFPAPDIETLSTAVEQALRLAGLMRAEYPQDTAWMADVASEPRPVVEVMVKHLDGDRQPPSRHLAVGWRSARHDGSTYARLLNWIAARADSGAVAIDLTAAVLDSLRVPRRVLTWPVDCTVRPLAGDKVVLDTVGPAGVADSRFAAESLVLHGRFPPAEGYRDFLRHLDAVTGVPSVELLVPPLSERAANAVLRPLYPRRWTGDPDLGRYCPTPEYGARYLPLSSLTVRRSDERLIVEQDGAPVRVLYHATRVCQPPWDVLSGLLLAGNPRSLASTPRLRHPLQAFPDRSHLPRLSLAGVVVAGAQWRLDPSDLWAPDVSELQKLRHLTRLRDRMDWPRWVFVSAYPWVRPVPCDLDSVRAVAVVEAMLAVDRPGAAPDADGCLLVEEVLPTPDRATLFDDGSGGHLVTELLLRLPSGLRPAVLAERVAAALDDRPSGSVLPLENPVGKGGD